MSVRLSGLAKICDLNAKAQQIDSLFLQQQKHEPRYKKHKKNNKRKSITCRDVIASDQHSSDELDETKASSLPRSITS
jgi:fatty acid/phospholipid biosynthesis enzyme